MHVDLSTAWSTDLSSTVGLCSRQGLRESMEDRVMHADLSDEPPFSTTCRRALLLGVFDGHAGPEAAQHLADQFKTALLASPLLMDQEEQLSRARHPPPDGCEMLPSELLAAAQQLAGRQLYENDGSALPPRTIRRRDYGAALREALLRCEEELLDAALSSGCTALVALVVDGEVHIANVGDCRAVVCDDCTARPLTQDHKPLGNLAERDRLRQTGAEVSPDGYVLSPDGLHDLAVSRALGGAPIKRPQSMLAMARVDSIASSLSGSVSDALSVSVAGVTTGDVYGAAAVRSFSLGKSSLPAEYPGAGAAAPGTGARPPGPAFEQLRHSASGGSRSADGGSGAGGGRPGAVAPDGLLGTHTATNITSVIEVMQPALSSCGCPSPSERSGCSPLRLDPPSSPEDCLLQQLVLGSTPAVLQLLKDDSGRLSEDSYQSGVIAEPELFRYTIHRGSEFLILASDGCWDMLNNNDAVLRVRRWLAEDGLSTAVAAQNLVELAMSLGASDNVSVVLLRFSSRPLPPRPVASPGGASGGRGGPYPNSALRRASSEAGLSSTAAAAAAVLAGSSALSASLQSSASLPQRVVPVSLLQPAASLPRLTMPLPTLHEAAVSVCHTVAEQQAQQQQQPSLAVNAPLQQLVQPSWS